MGCSASIYRTTRRTGMSTNAIGWIGVLDVLGNVHALPDGACPGKTAGVGDLLAPGIDLNTPTASKNNSLLTGPHRRC